MPFPPLGCELTSAAALTPFCVGAFLALTASNFEVALWCDFKALFNNGCFSRPTGSLESDLSKKLADDPVLTELQGIARTINGLVFEYRIAGLDLPAGVQTQVDTLIDQANAAAGGDALAEDFIANFSVADTVFWIGPTGEWTENYYWSENVLPMAGEDVIIDVDGTISVTQASGNVSVANLRAEDRINLTGGTLDVSGTFYTKGNMTFERATIANATISAGPGARINNAGGNPGAARFDGKCFGKPELHQRRNHRPAWRQSNSNR